MSIAIEMPKLSDTMTEGTLVRWLKKVGDKVEIGDVLAEVETDKATMEMEAFDEGTLIEVLVEDGQVVSVGQKLGVLGDPGETPSGKGQSTKTAATKSTEDQPATSKSKAAKSAPPAEPAESSWAEKPAKDQVPEPEEGAAGGPDNEPVEAEVSAGSEGDELQAAADQGQSNDQHVQSKAAGETPRIKVSPLARKTAENMQVDLGSLTGTGPSGRIVRADVVAAAEKKTSASPKESAPVDAGAGQKRIPLTGMRRTIANRLLEAKTTIPHFYLQAEVDAEPLVLFRQQINAALESAGGPKITVNDFILRATAVAAMRVPQANAAFAGDAFIQFAGVQLACAVAVDDGLVTPVIRNAQSKSLTQISTEIKDLANRARNKKLKPEEYQGGTITVSNLGGYGVEQFFAIINPPQSVIVSVGAIVKKPVVNAADQVVAGQRIALGISCDHRVVDGAVGARFLSELKQLMENPALALI